MSPLRANVSDVGAAVAVASARRVAPAPLGAVVAAAEADAAAD